MTFDDCKETNPVCVFLRNLSRTGFFEASLVHDLNATNPKYIYHDQSYSDHVITRDILTHKAWQTRKKYPDSDQDGTNITVEPVK